VLAGWVNEMEKSRDERRDRGKREKSRLGECRAWGHRVACQVDQIESSLLPFLCVPVLGFDVFPSHFVPMTQYTIRSPPTPFPVASCHHPTATVMGMTPALASVSGRSRDGTIHLYARSRSRRPSRHYSI